MKKAPLVSIVIPTRNSAIFFEDTLKSIKKQSYNPIEVIVVDGKSTDATISIAKKYGSVVYSYVPKVPKNTFDAPHKRNYGVIKAKGEFVYYVDADMTLTKNVIRDAVALCKEEYDSIIIPEDSFGKGIWARAKNLERRCYWGDNSVEAPRFFRKSAWKAVGGLDESLGGGGDDWDLYQKILRKGYKVGRIHSLVLHNEGSLRLLDLIRKRFMYGKDTVKYIAKRPKSAVKSYFPVRLAYIKHWKLFAKRPVDAIAFIFMRFAEYVAGFAGIVYTYIIV